MAFMKCLLCQKFARIQYVLAVTWVPLDCLEHILPLIFIRCSNAPTAMNLFELLSCSFDITNMRILDTEHTKDIYERLLKKQNVLALTLRPIRTSTHIFKNKYKMGLKVKANIFYFFNKRSYMILACSVSNIRILVSV